MNTHFTEINASAVKDTFPAFYDKQGRFFEIVKSDHPIGFVGIRPLYQTRLCQASLAQTRLCQGDCELEVFIFKQCRNALTKGAVLAVLDLPESLGFKRCWMTTTLKTVVKLFNSMEKYGIISLGLTNKKHVFTREF